MIFRCWKWMLDQWEGGVKRGGRIWGLGSRHLRGRGRWGIVTWMREERVQLDRRWKVNTKEC